MITVLPISNDKISHLPIRGSPFNLQGRGRVSGIYQNSFIHYDPAAILYFFQWAFEVESTWNPRLMLTLNRY